MTRLTALRFAIGQTSVKVMLTILVLAVAAPARADQTKVKITKMPGQVSYRSFDPRRPPRDLPELKPPEIAVCASDFLADAAVGGQVVQPDATHARVTIDVVNVTLRLNITIWLPQGADKATREHEEGHRQISEYYYRNAEIAARRVAEPYIGRTITIRSSNLRAAVSEALDRVGAEITKMYNAEIPVETTQDRYDSITEHSRRDIPVPSAVLQAIKETASVRRQRQPREQSQREQGQPAPQPATTQAQAPTRRDSSEPTVNGDCCAHASPRDNR